MDVASKGCLSYNLIETCRRCEGCCHSVTNILSSRVYSISSDLVIAFFSVVFLTFTQRFQRKLKELQPHGVPHEQVEAQG